MMYLCVFCMDRYGSIISLNEGSRLINISVGSHRFSRGKEDTDYSFIEPTHGVGHCFTQIVVSWQCDIWPQKQFFLVSKFSKK